MRSAAAEHGLLRVSVPNTCPSFSGPRRAPQVGSEPGSPRCLVGRPNRAAAQSHRCLAHVPCPHHGSVLRLQELPGGPPAPAILSPHKDHNQGRTSSPRCGRSTLILIFHGKIGAHREDGSESGLKLTGRLFGPVQCKLSRDPWTGGVPAQIWACPWGRRRC